MDVIFKKNTETRLVKMGFSWQLALFNCIAFFWRKQYRLALFSLAYCFVMYFVLAFLGVMIFDVDADVPAQMRLFTWVYLLITLGSIGYYGNGFSGRDYIRQGYIAQDGMPRSWVKFKWVQPLSADHALKMA